MAGRCHELGWGTEIDLAQAVSGLAVGALLGAGCQSQSEMLEDEQNVAMQAVSRRAQSKWPVRRQAPPYCPERCFSRYYLMASSVPNTLSA
jgi:hypothetical protein